MRETFFAQGVYWLTLSSIEPEFRKKGWSGWNKMKDWFQLTYMMILYHWYIIYKLHTKYTVMLVKQ